MGKKDRGLWPDQRGSLHSTWAEAVEANAEIEKDKGLRPCPDMEKVRDLVSREGKDVCPDPPP